MYGDNYITRARNEREYATRRFVLWGEAILLGVLLVIGCIGAAILN